MNFEQMYRTCFRPVYLYILRLSGDAHIAEEITAETFFRALRASDSFRGDCDIRVWLCQIAKNLYYSHVRKNSRVNESDMDILENIQDSSFTPEDLVCIDDSARHIRKILHEMPEPYKEVFMWRVYGDLSFGEIGRMYRKSDNWACVTYHRARKIIRRRLEDENHEE